MVSGLRSGSLTGRPRRGSGRRCGPCRRPRPRRGSSRPGGAAAPGGPGAGCRPGRGWAGPATGRGSWPR
ncbi:hypothetical protein COW53_07950 [bacterium CG17_big_fil_post_rev_8_21_14_2_50_64_8]|nr:MAG: hypothetical protein COW53_07950 [bacterium CG17_big_fil_post_rev_8_21_14_2_50_64_8]